MKKKAEFSIDVTFLRPILCLSFLILTSYSQASPICEDLFIVQPSLNFKSTEPQKFFVGPYQSRAIWTSGVTTGKAPLVILVPGSGPNGPEELIPGTLTLTGKSEPLFSQFSQPFHEAGIHTLALGKPGIDFAGPTDQPFQVHFYDRDLYLQLQWKDLIQNLDEAVRFAKTLPNVDPEKIYILGHSEGTQVAVDYAQKHSSVKGIILLGYYAVSMSRIIDFQDFIRPIQYFVEPSVDANHDGYITREEASQWPEFAVATQWQWPQGQERVSIQELQNYMRSRPDLKANYNQMQNLPIWKAVWNRSPIYHEMASLKQDVYIYNGTEDLQTLPEYALGAAAAMKAAGKTNYQVSLIPGVGHGFSAPRPPRSHPYLDMTVGPVSSEFQSELSRLAEKIK